MDIEKSKVKQKICQRKTETFRILKKYIFFLILTPDIRYKLRKMIRIQSHMFSPKKITTNMHVNIRTRGYRYNER